MQAYAEARLTDQEGRALWLSMFHEVKSQRLMAPSLPRTLAAAPCGWLAAPLNAVLRAWR